MKLTKSMITALGLVALSTQAWAIPRLQLDIASSSTFYDGADETIVTTDEVFTLNAYLWDTDPTGDFRISIALTPIQDEATDIPDFGSFMVDTTPIDNTYSSSFGAWSHGTPPAEFHSNPDELAKHGVFETYYLELDANFVAADTRAAYNTMDDELQAGEVMMFVDYAFDLSAFDVGNYQLHFDLYEVDSGGVVDKAPFSHDAATSISVPEPGMLALLGLGLLGIGIGRLNRVR